MDIESRKEVSVVDRIGNALSRLLPTLQKPVEDAHLAEPTAEKEKAIVDSVAAELARIVLEPPMRVTSVPSRRFETAQHLARPTAEGSNVIGFQPERMRIAILNTHDANDVWLSGRPETATTTTGFRIAAGATVTLETQAALFVRAEAGETAALSLLIEFGD